jgi:hypothetical protein
MRQKRRNGYQNDANFAQHATNRPRSSSLILRACNSRRFATAVSTESAIFCEKSAFFDSKIIDFNEKKKKKKEEKKKKHKK